ncbi:MAG: hypothetical protein D6755_01155 [Anaerolineae bacterium]|nr:MAG: hypothetical protein D6755_01155 [Anaerolineae bacterium]
MERTVPTTASEEIELYLRTVYSLLRSTTEVQLRTLEEVHTGMESLLHPLARQQQPDMSAFIYSFLRLPPCMPSVHSIVLGQSARVFSRHGYPDVEAWQRVSAPARRRRCFFDGEGTLACFIASRSDIEDVIPVLVAYQIEWNKLHLLLQQNAARLDWSEITYGTTQAFTSLADALELEVEDLERLRTLWGKRFVPQLQQIAAQKCDFRVRLLSGSMSEYRRATYAWWRNIEQHVPLLAERPVYFVSSNTHSVVNLLSGFALRHENHLIDCLHTAGDEALLTEWEDIRRKDVPSSAENFLYYILKKAYRLPNGEALWKAQLQDEQACGITRVPSEHYFEVDAQVIELARLNPAWFDPRLGNVSPDVLRRSDALILNIDYPLGLAAYNILSQVAEYTTNIQGVYVMGKAATLNGVRGDVMIPNVVHDEHSRNTYLFHNTFCAADVSPYLVYGTVLDNQKAVTVPGTFLQTTRYMDVFYREGYTDIEMEAGPYLSALYEMYRPKRHPVNEIVDLHGVPFDIGILHYASDTPLSKGKNLGAGTLSYFGMDSTYATTIAILRRILQQEQQRLM